MSGRNDLGPPSLVTPASSARRFARHGGDLSDHRHHQASGQAVSTDDAVRPLTPEARHDLIASYITNQDQLNQVEQLGIAKADRWAFSRRRDVLGATFLILLHRPTPQKTPSREKPSNR